MNQNLNVVSLNKNVELIIGTAKMEDDERERLRVFDSTSNRSLIIVSSGYTLSWNSREGQKLRFQFPQLVDVYVIWDEESKKFREEEGVALFHLPEASKLSCTVNLPEDSKEKFSVLEYALFEASADNFVRGDSPPKIIFMFR